MELFKEHTETEIIRRIIKGEKSLYEIIVRRFNSFLYKIGRSYNYNHDDTLDLMQDTYVDAYQNLSKFEGRAHFKTWIIRIMLNNCFRKKEKFSFKNEIRRDIYENSQPMFSNTNSDTHKIVQTRELGHIIEEALGKIPEAYRMVFALREINGLNVSDTAELLKISEANVKIRLNRAKSMLRNNIETSYSAGELFEFNAIYCNTVTERVMNIINRL